MNERISTLPVGRSELTVDDLAIIDHLCWSWHDPIRFERAILLLAERAAAIAGVSGAAVFLAEDHSGKMHLQAAIGMSREAEKTALRLAEKAVLPTQPPIIGDGVTLLVMPAENGVCGAIALPFEDEPPSDAVLRKLQDFCERAGLAAVRGHQCSEAFERLGIVDSLLDISKAVVDEMEVSKALKMVAERAAKMVKAELTAVALIDRKTKELHYVQSFGELAEALAGARVPLRISMRAFVTRTGEPLVINDAAVDPRVPRAFADRLGIRSLLIVPMRVRKRIIGVLMAANKRGGHFAVRDLRVFETIANHGAASVAHAELHDRARTAISDLDREKTKIEAVLAQLGDGVVVCDADGKIIMLNNAAQEIIGLQPEQSIGKTLAEMHPPIYRKEIGLVMKQLAGSSPGDGLFLEQNITLPDRKVVRMNIRPVFLKNGTYIGAAAILQDITQQVEIDEAKREFVSIVAHELRTPLTALKGSLGLMMGGAVGEVDARQRDLMGIAQNNCDRLIRLVDDMLDIAKIEAGHLRLEMDIVSVQDRMIDAVRQMRHLADERQVNLAARVIGKPHTVVGDGDRIEQVVTNLIVNAVKFSPPGSTVEITAKQVRGYVRVSVTDQGPGVPKDKQKKVFEKFFQINGQPWQKGCGSGLGLAISKAIIEQHGGKIGVKSVEGQGSTFAFLLPVPGEDTLLTEERDE